MTTNYKSIVCADNSKCYWCGSMWNLEKHHTIFGTANRKKAEEDGLYVMLCHDCHQAVHHENTSLKEYLQKNSEIAWLCENDTKSIQDFRVRFGRNYL